MKVFICERKMEVNYNIAEVYINKILFSHFWFHLLSLGLRMILSCLSSFRTLVNKSNPIASRNQSC
ncbi:unnamed protein product [Moneuplotes crassus]|uniref:Uncharacterized protein n=1 Tax=Euplotes crassus TaxID=5936 RepID=A0AAD1XKR6_EUPCR|nr:unnamed protein product [Moneuplotes crassus]